jgi:hypothetical protein
MTQVVIEDLDPIVVEKVTYPALPLGSSVVGF